jgi:Zinc-finger of C2H2 type
MRLIHNPQAVVCPICQKHFNSDLYLKRHYASIHSINSSNSGDDEKGTNTSNANAGNNWNYNESAILN